MLKKINELYTKLSTNPGNFNDIINRIIQILDKSIKRGLTGNEPTFSQGTVKNLKRLMSLFEKLNKMYGKVLLMKEQIEDYFKNLRFNNLYVENNTSNKTFNISNSIKIIKELNTVMLQINWLKADINNDREFNEPKINFSNISVDLQFLYYLLVCCQLLNENNNKLNNAINTFYDYFNIINNSTFNIYNSNDKYLNVVKSKSFDNSIFEITPMNKPKMSLYKFIRIGLGFKDKNKMFFDIDFGKFYNELFVETIIKPINKSHLNKLLTTSSISNINGVIGPDIGEKSLFYNLYTLLLSQQEYSKKNNLCYIVYSKVLEIIKLPTAIGDYNTSLVNIN